MANILKTDKQLDILSHLADGCGIRQTSRLCKVNVNTVMRYLLRFGSAASDLLDKEWRNLTLKHVSLDEQHTFVGIKSRNIPEGETRNEQGDWWLHIAQCVNSRAIVSHLVAPRTDAATRRFISDLASRINMPSPHESDDHAFHKPGYVPVLQVSSDAWGPYVEALDSSFGRHNLMYGQIVKSTMDLDREPREFAERRKVFNPHLFSRRTINTSYIERSNLIARHFLRRLNRRSLCFSKSAEHLTAAVALYACYWNYCWVPREIGGEINYKTPAQLACLESRQWTTADLYEKLSN